MVKPVDYRYRTAVPLLRKDTGEHEFTVLIYGLRPDDLTVIPCEPISRLAAKYPDHTSSMFLLSEPPIPGRAR